MGGEGSGIKGHTTPKEFVESKIKKVQSILEFAIGTDIVEEFDIPLEIRPIEFMEEFTPAMIEVNFEGKPEKIIISSEYAKPKKTHPLERMIGHEMTHCLFSRMSQQSKGAGEGLAVLASSFVDDKPTESIQYLVWAMGMAEVLEDITEERKIGIRELLKEYHDLDKMSINQRILNFSAQDKEQKLLGDLNKKHSDMVEEIVTGYEEGLVGEGGKVNLKILREDFELSVKKFFNLFRTDKTFSKGGKGSGVKGHTTQKQKEVAKKKLSDAKTLKTKGELMRGQSEKFSSKWVEAGHIIREADKKIDEAAKVLGREVANKIIQKSLLTTPVTNTLIEKGGAGSGIKGHKRDMPDIKRLDTDFAGMEIQQVRRKLLNYYAPGEIRDMESKNGEKSLRARLQSAVTGKPVSFKKAAMASTLSGEPGYVPMPEVYDGMGKPIKTKKNEKKIFDLVAAMYKEIQEEVNEEWDRLFEKGIIEQDKEKVFFDTYESLFGGMK